MKQDYKWSVIYNTRFNRFEVTGYISSGQPLVNRKWSQDGETLQFPTLEEALLSVYKSESTTSRTRDY